ncbi:hypothetical protein GCM10009847_27120 [Leucobacter tardus]|uniref:Cell wall synthesis protein Wag31 n=1 Tax=Leucobacter tardus TaxID=501483 RepID=A0A939QFB2_9MICO|nr:DivIVA domain-containing protein [Leucobacter tardus]MBO2989785.1 DivIVA domain-containing protein [Leucobacter tardus]
MALTPEDVVNQKFTITKFRDGYDLDQVDDFLDTIVEELRQHEQEKAALNEQIERLNGELEEARAEAARATEAANSAAQATDAAPAREAAEERTIVVDAPAPAPAETAVASSTNQNDAIKSSAMLQLALELHDKHINEGEEKRDQLIRDAQETSKQLIEEAQKQRADELRLLSTERTEIGTKIKDLREFEGEYRSTLRSYIQSQLRGLDGSPEPSGAPEGLE